MTDSETDEFFLEVVLDRTKETLQEVILSSRAQQKRRFFNKVLLRQYRYLKFFMHLYKYYIKTNNIFSKNLLIKFENQNSKNSFGF